MLQAAHARADLTTLVLLDVQMPDMDGFDAGANRSAIRRIGRTRLIMLSSADMAITDTMCSAVKLARYLTKPVKQSELFDMLIDGAAAGGTSSEAPAARSPGATRTQ